MAWEERTIENSGTWDKQEPVEGKLTKTESGIGPNESMMYTVTKKDGTEVKIWGSTVLDDKLLGVPENSLVKIQYEGMKPSKKGGKYHDYKVWIDTEGQPGYEKAKAKAEELKHTKAEDVELDDLEPIDPEELENIPY